MSDDGAFAIVVIVLLGNPFSPAYARARARGPARPLDFCSLHVALRGPRGQLWALTERPIPDAARCSGGIAIGKSRVVFEGDALIIDVHERTTPIPGLLRGRVTLHVDVASSASITLDAGGEHTWWPVAPLARVEVDLESPAVRFEGYGYHDANAGQVPIDASFAGWTWSRARVGDRVAVTYDVVERGGQERANRVLFERRGMVALEKTWRAPLPATRWRLDRHTAADAGHAARVVQPLTDGPFYGRALVGTRLLGQHVLAVHEVLSADRLRRAWVRFLLGFRMARGTP